MLKSLAMDFLWILNSSEPANRDSRLGSDINRICAHTPNNFREKKKKGQRRSECLHLEEFKLTTSDFRGWQLHKGTKFCDY